MAQKKTKRTTTARTAKTARTLSERETKKIAGGKRLDTATCSGCGCTKSKCTC